MTILYGWLVFGTSNFINPVIAVNAQTHKPVSMSYIEQQADLRVAELNLVSVTKNDSKKEIRIQVLILVKNTGTAACGPFQISGYYQPGNTQKETRCRESIEVTGLAPGASFVKVYIFNEPESVFREPFFSFRIKADAGDRLSEKSKQNNYSDWLRLQKPL